MGYVVKIQIRYWVLPYQDLHDGKSVISLKVS